MCWEAIKEATVAHSGITDDVADAQTTGTEGLGSHRLSLNVA